MCEIKHWNNLKIISVFYFTCNHVWNWNKTISAAEIISKLFQRHWTGWKRCNKLLKSFWNNFRKVSTCWNKIFWNNFTSHVTTALHTYLLTAILHCMSEISETWFNLEANALLASLFDILFHRLDVLHSVLCTFLLQMQQSADKTSHSTDVHGTGTLFPIPSPSRCCHSRPRPGPAVVSPAPVASTPAPVASTPGPVAFTPAAVPIPLKPAGEKNEIENFIQTAHITRWYV